MPGKPKPMITRTGGRGNEGNVTLFSKSKPKSDDKKKFDPRTGEETDKPRGKGPRTIYRPKPENPLQMRTGGLSPKQKKIAAKAPPPNKITGADFAVLKKEKAKGRGMGLQDEKVKPGKVQKAFLGKMIKGVGKGMGRIFGRKQSSTANPGAATMSGSGKGMGKMLPQLLQKAIDDGVIKPASKGRMMKANKGKSIDTKAFKKTLGVMPTIDKAFPKLKADPTKPISSVAPKVSDALKKKKLPGRIGTALGIGSMLVPAAYAAAKQYKDYKSAKNRDKAKVKKYNTGGDIEVKQLDPLGKRLSDVGMTGGVGRINKFVLRNQKKAIQKIPNKNFKSPTTSGKEQKKLAIKEQKNIESKMTRKGQEYKPVITRSKGGGADTGRAGERRSRLLTAVQRAARRAGREGFPSRPSPKSTPRGGPIGNEDRLTNKDLEYAKAGLAGAARPIGSSVIKAVKQFRDNYKADVRDKAKVKKMGGGMMQRPMGYKSGTMVKARGCKLGRTRPTKIT